MRSLLFTVCLITAALAPTEAGADWRTTLEIARNGNVAAIDSLAHTVSGIEQVFLKAVMEPDGRKARNDFFRIWENYRPHPLAWEALERERQYYYAMGDYKESNRLADLLLNRPVESIVPLPPPEETGGGFFVQVSAFSVMKNARQQVDLLTEWGYPAAIAAKSFGRRSLHTVRVGGYQTREEALVVGRELENRLSVRVRLLEN